MVERTIAVFGSSEPAEGDPIYEAARATGRLLAASGFAVATGGYGGVMEAASRGAAESGGRTIGVTCAIFPERRANPWVTEIRETRDLHERQRVLVELAEGYVVLPGKSGTLAELTLLWALHRAGSLPPRGTFGGRLGPFPPAPRPGIDDRAGAARDHAGGRHPGGGGRRGGRVPRGGGLSVGSRAGFGDDRATAPEAPPPKGVIRDYVETILVCVIFVLFTRAFVFQQSKIPSGSMEDTLLVGDYIMVNRFVYAPTQWDWEKGLFPVREIRRGDVVVFKYPNTPEIDYIKRVVGLPGDKVEVRDGDVWLNDVKLEEPFVTAEHRIPREFFPAQIVQPGHLWVMGDHRNASSDSRVWGQLPIELVKGRALLIWWSYPDERESSLRPGSDQLAALVRKIVTFPWRSRWSRCFELIR